MPEPLGQAVGRAIQQRREALGLTQSDLAHNLQGSRLVDWSRDVIAGVESGRRSTTIAELVGVALVLKYSVLDLLDGPADVLVGGKQLSPSAVRAAVTGNNTTRSGKERLADIAELPPVGMNPHTVTPSDESAARKLDVTSAVVLHLAEQLYGHSLGAERDERVRARAPADASPATLGAIRGHAFREVFAELEPVLEQRLDDAGGSVGKLIAEADQFLAGMDQ